jgi:hypothetical protein
MNDEPLPRNPPRLTGDGGEAGRLLRSVEDEFREKLDESGAFRSIERLRRRRAALSWGALGASVVVGILALTQGFGSLGPAPAEITLTAEPLPAPFSPETPPLAPVEEQRPAARVAPPPRMLIGPARPLETEHRDEQSCRKLAAEGEAEHAVDCFRSLARGQGIGAEVASYEAARISAEALRDPPRTLRLLDEHAARFPSGAMRGEVRWLRVQSLERAGRFDEALSESETLLAAPEGRALSSELHWLRARIYESSKNDCQLAASELVALVGEPGARGDEAEMRRAACFERMGRTNEALSAYEKYLQRAEPRRAVEARAKVEALRP